jgi:hypothetical protein
VTAMSVAGFAQDHLNAGAAISLAACFMDPCNLLGQAGIFLGARAGLGGPELGRHPAIGRP